SQNSKLSRIITGRLSMGTRSSLKVPCCSRVAGRLLHVRLVFVLIVTIVAIAVGCSLFFHRIEDRTLDLDPVMTEALQGEFYLLDRVQAEAGHDQAGAGKASHQCGIGHSQN